LSENNTLPTRSGRVLAATLRLRVPRTPKSRVMPSLSSPIASLLSASISVRPRTSGTAVVSVAAWAAAKAKRLSRA
jgi:hypothetical protein